MNFQLKILFLLVAASIVEGLPGTIYNITEIFCDENPEFETDVECKINVNGNNPSSVNLKANIIKPIENLKINFKSLSKKDGTYKPSTVDITFDGCDFLNGKNLNPVTQMLREILKNYSISKYSCPIKGPMELKDIQIKSEFIPIVIPNGEYQFQIKAFWDNPQVVYVTVKINLHVFSAPIG